MKVCWTRDNPETLDLDIPAIVGALTAEGAAARIDIVVRDRLLTVFRGDPAGLSVDLRYEGHRLNVRIAFDALASLLQSSDLDAWLRAAGAHDEEWECSTDADYAHARALLA